MRSRKALLAAVAVSMSLFGGCVNFQVDEHSYQFNEATGSLNLRLLLLNAVRASKDYPLQFSKIQAYQGTGTSSASVSASLPLPVPGNGTMSPKVDWKDGVSQLSLVDLNTEEAQQALRKVVSINVYEYFYKQSGARSLIAPFMLTIEHIHLATKLHALVKEHAKKRCDVFLKEGYSGHGVLRFTQRKAACAALEDLEAKCPGLYDLSPTQPGSIVLKDDLTSECGHNAFMALRLQLTVVGVGVLPLRRSGKDDGKSDRPTSIKKAPGNTFNIFVTDPKEKEKNEPDKEDVAYPVADPVFAKACVEKKLCKPKPGYALLTAINFQLRSPERMVRYLGELIAAQNYGPDPFIPYVFDPERGEKYALLLVKRGAPPPGGAAVSVISPDGETFYVPRRDHDARKTDLSLESLSIVTDVLNAAVSKKAFPAVTTLSVKAD